MVAIQERKLEMVRENYCCSLTQFENYSLMALTTIYGVELLDDNVEECVMNMYECFYKVYYKVARQFKKTPKNNVLNCAKVIIRSNMSQGDFLKRTKSDGSPIVFSEWKAINKLNKRYKTISVSRTEYTLQDIFEKTKHVDGTLFKPRPTIHQLELFDDFESYTESNDYKQTFRFSTVKITEVYKEEIESIEE